MKLDHERLEVYEEVPVYEYVNEYEYGGEAGSAAPRLRRSVRLEPIGVGIGIAIGIEDDMSSGHERLEVYRAAIESAGRVHRATDRCRCRSRFRPRGSFQAGRTTTTRGNPWHSVTGAGRFRVHGFVFDGTTDAIRSRVLTPGTEGADDEPTRHPHARPATVLARWAIGKRARRRSDAAPLRTVVASWGSPGVRVFGVTTEARGQSATARCCDGRAPRRSR